MLRACALVLLCGVPVASPAFVRPVVACSWLLPCDTPGSGAVGRGLQPEDAVVVLSSLGLSGMDVRRGSPVVSVAFMQ